MGQGCVLPGNAEWNTQEGGFSIPAPHYYRLGQGCHPCLLEADLASQAITARMLPRQKVNWLQNKCIT